MIRLTAKSRYAVSALLHLAIHNRMGPVPLAEVSVCQGISMSYVDQIFTKLRRADLVRGTPGPGGGYRLGRPADRISIGEVIELMEGQRVARRTLSALDEVVWRDLAEGIADYLRGVTLADFVRQPEIRESVLRDYRGGRWRCDVCGVLADRRGADGGRALRS